MARETRYVLPCCLNHFTFARSSLARAVQAQGAELARLLWEGRERRRRQPLVLEGDLEQFHRAQRHFIL